MPDSDTNRKEKPKRKPASRLSKLFNILLLLLVVIAIGMALGFFSPIREGLRDLANDEMSGKEAPSLLAAAEANAPSADWVLPAGVAAPKESGWRVVAFFKNH